jgi:hypothetical protein
MKFTSHGSLRQSYCFASCGTSTLVDGIAFNFTFALKHRVNIHYGTRTDN